MNLSSSSLYFSLDLINNNNIQTISNETFSLFQFNHPWIFSLFILSLFGILFTIIILFLFLYFSIRGLNDHLILPNLFLCLSVCFLYITVIFFLIRAKELFCGLREFLSQLTYVLLFSAFLSRYIMQWLATRILSKRTKQLTFLLIYFLLIFIQLPIGILWWYFTIPRLCQQHTKSEYSKFKFHFHKRILSSKKSCSYQCNVEYRFYATYTYIILELVLCTIISICLFLCRYCHRNKKDRLITNHHHGFLTFFNMCALILINITWLIWTLIYYFTHSVFIFPSIVIGMFTIGTICLFFILIPQIYFYSKIQISDIHLPKTILFSNKLASLDEDLLLQDKYLDQNKQQILSNESELSYELGTSGTFLPLTRTPKGPFKVMNAKKTSPIEKLDKLIYGEHLNAVQNKSTKNERKINTSETDVTKEQLQSSVVPLQRQLTSSSIASHFKNPILSKEYLQHSNSNIPSYRDETLIPILCSSKHQPTSTPVKMRILVKSTSSSVPTTRRIYSGIDHRYIQHPYHHCPPSPSVTPLHYPRSRQQQNLFVDPYRTTTSHSGGNLWQSILPSPPRYPYSYRRFHLDNRSLSQRLWDIDSGDDQDETEENILNTPGHITPTGERLEDFRSSQIENNDADEENNSYNKKLIFI